MTTSNFGEAEFLFSFEGADETRSILAGKNPKSKFREEKFKGKEYVKRNSEGEKTVSICKVSVNF